MKLHQQIVDIMEKNESLQAAKLIATIISELSSQKEVEDTLYLALMQAERKGKKYVATLLAEKSENVFYLILPT